MQSAPVHRPRLGFTFLKSTCAECACSPAPAGIYFLEIYIWGGFVSRLSGDYYNGWRLPPVQPTVGDEPDDASPATPSPVTPSPSDIGCAYLAYQAARKKLGLPFSIEPAPPPAPQAAAVAPSVPAVISGPVRLKVKMSEVVNQTMDQEIDVRSASEMSNMVDIYAAKVGAEPLPAEDPTAEQVSCIEKLIESELPPSPDLAIFGPYGAAIHRKLRFKGQIFVGNKFITQELAGPPSYLVWKTCMAVLKVVYIFIQAVSPQRFDNYVNHVGALTTLYGDRAWAIIYQADVEMRTQEFARIKARLDRKHLRDTAFRQIVEGLAVAGTPAPRDPDSFNPDVPWDGVFFKSITGSKAEAYWTSKVHRPALMMCTDGRRGNEFVHDHNIHPAAGSAWASDTITFEDQTWNPSSSARPAAARTRSRTPRGVGENNDLSSKDDTGRFITNRKGAEVCRNFPSRNVHRRKRVPKRPFAHAPVPLVPQATPW